MVYQIGGYDADWNDFPTKLSQFWAKSFGGKFRESYREGREAGKADLAFGSFSFLEALDSIEVSERGNAWRANLDGYLDATKSRGPTKFG